MNSRPILPTVAVPFFTDSPQELPSNAEESIMQMFSPSLAGADGDYGDHGDYLTDPGQIPPSLSFYGRLQFLTSPTQISSAPYEYYPTPTGNMQQPPPPITEDRQASGSEVAFDISPEAVINPMEKRHYVKDLSKDLRQALESYIHEIKNGLYRCCLDKCSDPTRIYDQPDEIIDHIRQDVKDRRYACGLCHLRFVNKSDCQRHVDDQNHPDRYPCEFTGCSKAFGRKDARKQHYTNFHNMSQIQEHEGNKSPVRKPREQKRFSPYQARS